MTISNQEATDRYAELNEKLDRFGETAPVSRSPEEQEYRKWRKDIWTELYLAYAIRYFGKDEDRYKKISLLIEDFIELDLPRFSPEKGSLSHYWVRIYNLVKNRYMGDLPQPIHEALSYTGNDGSEYENPHVPHDMSVEEAQDRKQDYLIEAIAKIILQLKYGSGTRSNSSAPEFFPMWFSEMTTHYTQDTNGFHSNNEKEIFEAFCLSYLDFFMEKKCRTLLQLRDAPLRMAAEIDPSARVGDRLRFSGESDTTDKKILFDGKRTNSPSSYFLKLFVPIAYFKPTRDIKKYTISKSRSNYISFIQKELLGEE